MISHANPTPSNRMQRCTAARAPTGQTVPGTEKLFDDRSFFGYDVAVLDFSCISRRLGRVRGSSFADGPAVLTAGP